MNTSSAPTITSTDLRRRVLRRYANTPAADVVAAAINYPDDVAARDALIRAYQVSDDSGRYLMAAWCVRSWLVTDRPVDSAADMVAMFPDDLDEPYVTLHYWGANLAPAGYLPCHGGGNIGDLWSHHSGYNLWSQHPGDNLSGCYPGAGQVWVAVNYQTGHILAAAHRDLGDPDRQSVYEKEVTEALAELGHWVPGTASGRAFHPFDQHDVAITTPVEMLDWCLVNA